MSEKQAPQKPVKEIRAIGGITAAIWRNQKQDGERTVVQHSVRIQKRYRDSNTGEWKNSDYFFPSDLAKLMLVTQKAYEFVTLHESENGFDPQEMEKQSQ